MDQKNKTMGSMKHVIIVNWIKEKKTEAYPTLTSFLAQHPVAPINTINNYISRKRVPYMNTKCIIEKLEIKREN